MLTECSDDAPAPIPIGAGHNPDFPVKPAERQNLIEELVYLEDIGRASGELAVHILPTPASPELMLDEGWKSKLRDSLVIHADQAALIRQLQLPETVTYIHTSVLLLAHDL